MDWWLQLALLGLGLWAEATVEATAIMLAPLGARRVD